ncbi:MAG: hypothetical protein ACREJN_03040, partial [Nitrospiraceae bacterium]
PWIGLQQVHGLLLQARQLNPMNRHLQIMQQAVTTQAGALPSGPPVGSPSQFTPHASLLVPPPPPQQHASPHLSPPPFSSSGVPGVHQGNPPAIPSARFGSPLPPTLQQVHPPHFAQQNPPILRAPFYTPSSPPRMSAPYFGGGRGHFGGGGHRGR